MESHPENPIVPPVAKSSETRWGMLAPFVTAGFRPATTARRTDHLSVKDALIVHVFAVILVVFAVTCSVAWSEADVDRSLADLLAEAILLWDDVLYEFSSMPPVIGLLVLVAILASCWGGYVLFAIVLSSWGARDEQVRQSIGRAIHRTWRHTPHILQVILLAGIIAVPLIRARQQAYHRIDSHDHAIVWNSFTEAEQQQPNAWSRAWYIAWESYPFYAYHGEELGAAVYFAGGLWLVWGFLSSISAGGKGPRIARSPMCEACGYNLTGAAMGGRCPECGRPVIDSLGPNARSGTIWQRRKERCRWVAFSRTAMDALLHPRQIGKELIQSPAAGDHRVFLLVWMPLMFVAAGAGSLLLFWTTEGHLPRGRDAEFLWLVCPMAGYFAAIETVFLTLITAGLVGFLGSWKHKRNMLPSAMQAACSAGGFLIVWLVVAFCAGAILLASHNFLFDLLRPYGIAVDIVVSAFLLGPSAICFAIYLWLVARIARGTRFANSQSPENCLDAH